jgi:hypothetical protein
MVDLSLRGWNGVPHDEVSREGFQQHMVRVAGFQVGEVLGDG